MLRRMSVLALVAMLLAACGAGGSSAADKFSGEEQRVAQVLEDLKDAGSTGDAAEICSRILSAQLVDRMAAQGRSCSQEVDDAVGDADDFDVDVERVQVKGAQADATVSNGDGPAQTVKFVRERKGWRISELAAPAAG